MRAESDTGEVANARPDDNARRTDLIPILRRLGRVHQLATGERLQRDRSADRQLYLIESGAIKLSLVTPGGAELIVGLFFGGDTMGLRGFGDVPDSDVATAFERTRVHALPLTVLKQLCRENPPLHRQIFHLASQRIAQLQRRMLVVAKSGACERVAGFLVELLNRRPLTSDGTLYLPLSLNDIGNYLCLSLETVCRSLRMLERQGVIGKNGRYVKMLDRARLVVMAGESGFIAD